jgi:hypothetical protein
MCRLPRDCRRCAGNPATGPARMDRAAHDGGCEGLAMGWSARPFAHPPGTPAGCGLTPGQSFRSVPPMLAYRLVTAANMGQAPLLELPSWNCPLGIACRPSEPPMAPRCTQALSPCGIPLAMIGRHLQRRRSEARQIHGVDRAHKKPGFLYSPSRPQVWLPPGRLGISRGSKKRTPWRPLGCPIAARARVNVVTTDIIIGTLTV